LPAGISTGQVTKVTVLQGTIYVAGAAPSGYECTNYAAFYGTLYSPSTDPAHKQYQALALSAYLTGKSLSCHVYHRDQSGTCRMDNCHIY
jgi:hypothetical protein